MPCSPVQVPSSAIARCTMRRLMASARRALLGVALLHQVGEVEVAVAHVADDVVGQARRVGLGHRQVDDLGQPRDRHAGVGGDGAAAGVQSACRRSRPCGAPSTAACAPRACWPTGSLRRRSSLGDRLHGFGLLLARRPRCRGIPSAASATSRRPSRLCALTARTAFTSSSSQRAMGTPIWMTWMVARTAASMLAKWQIAALTASGSG